MFYYYSIMVYYNIVVSVTSYAQLHTRTVNSEMKPATACELNLLGVGFWYFGELEGILDSSKFRLVGACCERQQDLESRNLKAIIMKGYLCAALIHDIFFVWPTDKAADNRIC